MKISRRTAFKGLLAASTLPLFSVGSVGFGQGRVKQIEKGAKLRVALIGCGIQGRMIINAILLEKLVAIVDPDPKQLARMDSEVRALRDPVSSANYKDVKKFSTYQDMFDAVGDELDAVIIETPNHQHILPAVMAIRRGIHVYLDKPLVLTAAEGDLLLEETRKQPGLVTQCGTYGHTFPSMKYCIDRINEGALGDIKEVWCYDDRVNSIFSRPASVPAPKGLDWDSWCGGSPICDYYPETPDQDGMHPHGWHSWIGYGNGSIGNLGMHIMDVAFWALGLKDPDSVKCHDAKFALDGAWAYRDVFEFHFPANEKRGEVALHWWDGLNDGVPYKKEYLNKFGLPHRREWLNIPPRVLEEEKKWGFEKDPFYSNGVLFIGSKANLWFTHHGGYRFLPNSAGWCNPRIDRQKDFNYRRNTLPHVREFYNAIRERREANDNFEYAVPLAKTVCLGNISALAHNKLNISELKWNGSHVTNSAEADKWVAKEYRKGWDPFEGRSK